MLLGHAISVLVFYYSLLPMVCDFNNAAEIFLLEPGGGGGACGASFTVSMLSAWRCSGWVCA
jgi:hypothetical protein